MTENRPLLSQTRREFLLFVAASTVVAPATRAWAQQLVASHEALPASAKDFLQVMDFEEAARRALPPAHWGYMATGVDDDLTLKANMEAFKHIGLKPRRLVDVSKADLSVDVFGAKWETPIFVCPVGGQQAFFHEGELATARAARAKHHQMILSSATSTALEEVAKAYGGPPWYQLYMPRAWSDTEKLVKRVEDAGCPVIAWTVDLLAGRNIPTATRFARQDTRNCIACHVNGPGTRVHNPMYEGLSDARTNPPEATWEYVDRLKKLTRMKVLLKGLDSADDARLAVEHGAEESSSRTMVDARPKRFAPPSIVSPRSCRRLAAASPCSSTADSATAPISTRHWRRGHAPSASAGRTSGVSPRSARKASSACSRFYERS